MTEYINRQWRLPNIKEGNNKGYSMDFNGSQAVVASNFTAFNGAEAASFSLWYKTSTTMQGKCLISFPNTSGANRFDLYIYTTSLPNQNPPKPGFRSYIVTSGGDPTHGSNLSSTATGLSPADGNWHNVIVAWDGTTINMYYDGVNIGSMAKNGSLINSSVDTLNIGMFAAGSYTNHFTGQIKDVAVFDYGLPETGSNSVATIFNGGTPFNPMALSSPPINYYPLGNSAHMGSNYLTPNLAIPGGYAISLIGVRSRFFTKIKPAGKSNITFSTWYRAAGSSSSKMIFYSGSYGTFYLRTNGAGGLWHGITVASGSTGSSAYATFNFDYDDGNWHHYIFNFDGSHFKTYIDGVLIKKTAKSGVLTSWGSTDAVLGSNHNTNSSATATGDYSNFVAYDSTLTDGGVAEGDVAGGEIAELYNGGSPIYSFDSFPQKSNIETWFRLDQTEIFSGYTWKLNDASSTYSSSLDFDGVDDLINLDNGVSLNSSGYSLSIWFNSNSFSSIQVLFTNAASNIKFVSIHNSTTIRVRDGVNQREFTVPSLNAELWYNLITVVDNGNCQVYLNSDVSSSPAQTVNQNWSIDAINGYSNFHGGSANFNGKLSNAQIFNTALPATGSNSVETIYNNGKPLADMSSFSSLVSWWKLDNTTTGIEDSKGSNNGTNNGATEVIGSVSVKNATTWQVPESNLINQTGLLMFKSYSPYALAFDGNDYIDCGNSADFSFGNGDTDSPFSTSFWFKLNSNSGTQPFLSKDNVTKEWTVSIFGGGGIRIFLKNLGTNNQQSIDSTTTFSTGVWYHAVTTYDGSGGVDAADGLSIYINGSLDAPTNVIKNTYTAMSSSLSDVTIGKYGGSYINGVMSNVAIWNTELTPAQVTEIYNEGLPSNLNNFSGTAPVAWWQLGSNSSWTSPAWTVLDEIGSNDGTSNGMLENAITDGVGTSGNGTSTNMGAATNISGSSPNGEGNCLSVNMGINSRSSDYNN